MRTHERRVSADDALEDLQEYVFEEKARRERRKEMFENKSEDENMVKRHIPKRINKKKFDDLLEIKKQLQEENSAGN